MSSVASDVAFRVRGALPIDVIRAVRDLLNAAVPNGGDFEHFRARALAVLGLTSGVRT